MFLDSDILPDAKIIAICLEDAHYLGVLSSRPHLAWALRTGAFLGVGNDSNYNHSACFGTFPFPDCTDDQKEKIRQLAEQLDAHRKARQAEHPDLTMTDMYNVLEKLRVGETLSAKDKAVHDKGLVSVLRQLHNDLDRAVFEAYGWPPGLSDEEILERLVALNKERAAEEARGTVRWLRPEFQNPTGRAGGKQVALLEDAKPKAAKVKAERARKTPWPKTPAERARLVRELLGAEPVTPEQLAKKFSGGPKDKADRVAELLDALVTLGQAVRQRGGKYRSATA